MTGEVFTCVVATGWFVPDCPSCLRDSLQGNSSRKQPQIKNPLSGARRGRSYSSELFEAGGIRSVPAPAGTQLPPTLGTALGAPLGTHKVCGQTDCQSWGEIPKVNRVPREVCAKGTARLDTSDCEMGWGGTLQPGKRKVELASELNRYVKRIR